MRTITTSALLLMCTYIYSTDAIRLKISGNNYYDETVIRFISGADDGFDNSYDASKLFSPNKKVPAIYTMADTIHPLCVNSYQPLANGGVNTGVYVRNYVATTYTISYEEFGAISPATCIYLEDVKTGDKYNLRLGISHTFQLPIDSISSKPRFVVHFTIPSTITTSDASCHKSNDGSISISKLGYDLWSYQLLNTLGKMVKTDSNIFSATIITGLAPGDYNLTICTKYGCSENFSVSIYISSNSIKALFISSSDSVSIASPTIHFVNQSEKGAKYVWDFGDLTLDSLSADPVHTYSNAGLYVIKLTAKKGGCSNTSQKTIQVVAGITTGITSDYSSKNIKIHNSPEGLMISMNQNLSTEIYNISVFNSLGQLLYNDKVKNADDNYLLPNFKGLNSILIIRVSSDKEVFYEKIFVGE